MTQKNVALMTSGIGRRAKLQHNLLPGALGAQLCRVEGLLFSGIQELTVQYDLTPSEFGVMLLISENPGLSQTDLGRALRADRSTMVAVVDRFEERNLAERRESPFDRRSHALALTSKGARIMRDLNPKVSAFEKELLGSLSADDQHRLMTLLNKIKPIPVALPD
jgi:DNA-binding MarR family transcriptional regulator